jgi:hypothetical protein
MPFGATVARLKDGSTGFGTWDGTAKHGWTPPDIDSFRQNLTAMVEDGKYNPWRRGSWGGGIGYITGSGPKGHIIRSGICRHESGHVMYVLGDPVDGPTLARTMQKVGCRYAMELDINRGHVGFELFNVLAKGEEPPPSADSFKPVRYFSARGEFPGLPGMTYYMREIIRDTGNSPVPRWTGPEARDFFYLVHRELLPTADLKPMTGQPNEGRWTTATLPESMIGFPQAMARTLLHPRDDKPEARVHLFQLDLRWLDTTLCVPSEQASCLPHEPGDAAPAAILPLGDFSGGRTLAVGGKVLHGGGGAGKEAARSHLVVAPWREGGPRLPSVARAPFTGAESVSIASATEAPADTQRRGAPVQSALCPTRDGILLYATGIGVERGALADALGHAGCNTAETIIYLGRAAPLVLRHGDELSTVYGELLPPVAGSPSLLLRRGDPDFAPRIFSHVKPLPRRLWTAVQPERTRSSTLRRAKNVAEELGLPPVKKLEDLCEPPYTEHEEMRKWRWRDPITGEMCGRQTRGPSLEWLRKQVQKVAEKRRAAKAKANVGDGGKRRESDSAKSDSAKSVKVSK